MEEIKSCRTILEVKNLMEKMLPGWCLGFSSKFSLDYPQLTANWNKVCENLNTRRAQIMIVKYIEEGKKDPENIFADCFSGAGFCVRRATEFRACPKCGDVIPTKIMYDWMKRNKMTVPEEWSEKCTCC